MPIDRPSLVRIRIALLAAKVLKWAWRILTLPFEPIFRRRRPAPAMLPAVFPEAYAADLLAAGLGFIPDYYVGYRPHESAAFIGSRTFISVHRLSQMLGGSDIPVILNLGDSSTSGWDARAVVRGTESSTGGVESPFFNYSTYPDLLRELLREATPAAFVLNAGVPGYSSVQGLRYFRQLLVFFQRLSIRLGAVTLYFGNNDSMWNGNLRDSAAIPASAGTLRNIVFNAIFSANATGRTAVQLLRRKLPESEFSPRVTLDEYSLSIRSLVAIARERGVMTILIRPPIPLRWSPGELLRGISASATFVGSLPGGTKALSDLTTARDLWQRGEELLSRNGEPEEVQGLLHTASELDSLTPRIKAPYSSVLAKIAAELSIPLIEVPPWQLATESQLFLDYCHPLPILNKQIAERILAVLPHRFPTLPPRVSFPLDDTVAVGCRGRSAASSPSDSLYPLF